MPSAGLHELEENAARSGREPQRLRRASSKARTFAHLFALPVILFAFLVLYSVLMPGTFATWQNLSTIISSQAVVGCLALAAIVPLAIGEFDLSFGYSIGLIGLAGASLGSHGITPGIVIILMILIGAAIGIVNGILVVYFNISSFIATLGVGFVVSGLSDGVSGGSSLFAGIPHLAISIGQNKLGGIIWAAWITLAVGVVLYFFLQHTPFGRYLFAIGGSKRVARLSGVNTNRYRLLAFVIAGTITGIAGILAVGENGSASPSFGPDLLLPAYAAVFLGVTSFRPGHYNVAGTLFALLVLGVGVSGIELIGAPLWIQPVFSGCALLLAVVVAREEARRVQLGS